MPLLSFNTGQDPTGQAGSGDGGIRTPQGLPSAPLEGTVGAVSRPPRGGGRRRRLDSGRGCKSGGECEADQNPFYNCGWKAL